MTLLVSKSPVISQYTLVDVFGSLVKQQAIASVPRLNHTKQLAVLFLADNPGIEAKDLAKAINVDRAVALKILKSLAAIYIAEMTKLPSQNSAIQGAYVFSLAPHLRKEDLLTAFNAKCIKDLEPSNKVQLKRFLEDLLDETAKKTVIYLCDCPSSTAKQIIEALELNILPKSLQDKLSALTRKVGLLKREKPPSGSHRVYQYSIVDEIPSAFLKEILLSEVKTEKASSTFDEYGKSELNNNQDFWEDIQIDKTKQNLSAVEYLKKVKELDSNRNKITILEKEICESGKLATDHISPLWSNLVSEDGFDKQPKPIVSVNDFLLKVRKLKHYRNKVSVLENEICGVGELAREHISPLWSDIKL